MRKFIFLLILLFPTLLFGQSFSGNYQARFISLDNNISPLAEFEVKSDGTVVGKIIVSQTTTNIRGKVNSLGNLEATSNESPNSYTLKANLNQVGKITLTRREQVNTGGIRSYSQSIMQGNLTRIDKNSSINTNKSELVIEQPNPFFEKIFTAKTTNVIVQKNDLFQIFHLQMTGGADNTERGFYFSIARPRDSTQKNWKIDNIRSLNYVEKNENFVKTNRFRITYEMWLKNKDIASGEIELVSENSRQMVFRIVNLKIKNEANDDIVTINGLVYAEISK
jgi:hypothetical protein